MTVLSIELWISRMTSEKSSDDMDNRASLDANICPFLLDRNDFHSCCEVERDMGSSKMLLTIYKAIHEISKLKGGSTRKGASIYSTYTVRCSSCNHCTIIVGFVSDRDSVVDSMFSYNPTSECSL